MYPQANGAPTGPWTPEPHRQREPRPEPEDDARKGRKDDPWEERPRPEEEGATPLEDKRTRTNPRERRGDGIYERPTGKNEKEAG